MTHKVGSFYDSVNPAQTFISLLHPDLIANGWQRVETNLDSGNFRWDVYKNPAANNSNNTDFYIALGRYWVNGAGVGTASATIYATIFEQWNTGTKQATNFPVWAVAISGTNAQGIANYGTIPRALPYDGYGSPYVASTTMTNNGTGYTSRPSVTISGAWPTYQGINTVAEAVMELSAVATGAGGSGYPASQSSLACTVSGGGGSGAIVTATTSAGGAVTGYTIVDRGTGYTSVPTVVVGGGGVGATNTVTLRVKSVTVTSYGNNYTYAGTVNFSGGGGSGAAANANLESGFAWQALSLGSNSTQYFYTVTNDMLAYSFRRDGNADSGGTYIGLFESFLGAADVMPLGVVGLFTGSTSATLKPFNGYGFSTREPGRGATGNDYTREYDCALQIHVAGTNSILHTGSTISAYSNYAGTHEIVSTSYVNGRGSWVAPRGKLKNVVFTPNTSGTHGDLLRVQQGATVSYARYVNAGHALLIV